MSGSMSLLLQMASNLLTTEDATALVTTIRKISLQIQDARTIHYAFLGSGWITELPLSKTVLPLAVCFIYCTVIKKKRLVFDSPSKSHEEFGFGLALERCL